MTNISEQTSRTFKLKNALVTIHGWSAGTAILNVTSTKEPTHISVWVSPPELRDLAKAFEEIADTMHTKALREDPNARDYT